jgi:hypothetical protein
MDDDMVSVNLTMLNINAICNVLQLLRLYSNYKMLLWLVSGGEQCWSLIVRPPEHIIAYFPTFYQLIALTETCTHSSWHDRDPTMSCVSSYTARWHFNVLLLLAFIYMYRVYHKNVHPFKFKLTVTYCSNLTTV